MNATKINWADSNWNPVTGCLHDCPYCYARNIAERFGGWDYSCGMVRVNIADDRTYIALTTEEHRNWSCEVYEVCGQKVAELKDPYLIEHGYKTVKAPYPFGFMPTLYRYKMDEYKKKSGRTIFVGSMTDMFGSWVPDEWIAEVLLSCSVAPQHRYLFLTKNPSRYNRYYSFRDDRPQNFYFGASATNYNDMVTIQQTLANSLNFLSLEPLHGFVDLGKFTYENPGHLDWIIVGAETGNRKEKVMPKREWIGEILTTAKREGIPVFMKESLRGIMGGDFIQEFPWEVKS